jgi:hypothetical protein
MFTINKTALLDSSMFCHTFIFGYIIFAVRSDHVHKHINKAVIIMERHSVFCETVNESLNVVR